MFEIIDDDVHFHISYIGTHGEKWYYFFDKLYCYDDATKDKTKADVLSEKESEEIIKKLMQEFGNTIFQIEHA